MKKRRHLRQRKTAAYRPLQTALSEMANTFSDQPQRRVRRWRCACRHVARFFRNAVERQEVQVIIDRGNQLMLALPIPRHPARHRVINPPFRSSARLANGQAQT